MKLVGDDCPRCDEGLVCVVASGMMCAGECFGVCQANHTDADSSSHRGRGLMTSNHEPENLTQLKSDDHSGAGGWQLYTGVQSSPAMVEAGAELEVHFSLAGSVNATSWTVTLRWMNGTEISSRRGAGVFGRSYRRLS